MKKLFYISAMLLLVISCVKQNAGKPALTPEQEALIGTEVIFDPYVEDFKTRVGEPSTDHTGFNLNSILYIYRQYWNDEHDRWEYGDPPVTVYKYKGLNNGSTGIFEKASWKVNEGMYVSFTDPLYENPRDHTHTYTKTLTADDAIIWENGGNVRFRAWGLSSITNTISVPPSDPRYAINYPDYMACDWVTLSGPTTSIPMSIKHMGCRIGFVPVGNVNFVNSDQHRIRISVDPEDYARDDNADFNENDEADKILPGGLTAAQAAANVKKVADLMCWPAGVAINEMSLMTISQTIPPRTYNPMDNALTVDFVSATEQDNPYRYTNIKHAEFLSHIDSRMYMISVPFDMTNNSPTSGEPLVLPPYTRFKVWLRDVNSGDEAQNGGAESNYHILSLSDVKKRDSSGNTINEQAFPNGLMLLAGYSYTFHVGYHNNGLTVTAADDFSWTDQNLGDVTATEQNPVFADEYANRYDWFRNAIREAIPTGTVKDYNPEFHITSKRQLIEFMDLINNKEYVEISAEGIARGYKKTGLYKAHRFNNETRRSYVDWYTELGDELHQDGSRDTVWATTEDKRGYIFYEHYFPSVADRAAYSEEDVLTSAYSFYDQAVQRSFRVLIDSDIDLGDYMFPNLGIYSASEDAKPFSGYLDGQGHVLKNVYFSDKDGNYGQIFNYLRNAVVSNLRIESSHPVTITGVSANSRILGCSILAPSREAALAKQSISTTSAPCYYVGNVHIGNTSKPLVDASSGRVYMYGCLQVSRGITGAALINTSTSDNYYTSQGEFKNAESIYWGNFACNYFDAELSPDSKAVSINGTKYTTEYHRKQYIRGTISHVICATEDFLVDAKTDWEQIASVVQRKIEYYGAAPWRAMNFGIREYNRLNTGNTEHLKCKMHYVASTAGYRNSYPVLTAGEPTSDQYIDVNELYN